MIKTKIQRKYLYTPLRYPGGKTSLFRFFEEIIGHNQWKDVVYIEPYAGGAGAALSLLITNSVSSIVINDYDSAIYSFWISILNETESFVEMM
jgi:DNA adenine methylase